MTMIEVIFTICVCLYYYIATIASGTYLLHNVEEKRTLPTILIILFGWGLFILLAGRFIGNCFLLAENRKYENMKKTIQNDDTTRKPQI